MMCSAPPGTPALGIQGRVYSTILNFLDLNYIVTSFLFTPTLTLTPKQGIKLQGKGLLCFAF